MKKIICILLIAFLSLSVTAGTIDPKNSDKKYTEFGEKFHFTGKIHGLTNDDKRFFGSCTAFSHRLIITAAHITSDMKQGYVSINNKTIKIIDFKKHELFDKFGKKYDISVCKLEDDIGLEWYPGLYNNHDEIGKLCTISGFGITGKFNSTQKIQDENRRAGSNTIDMIEDGNLVCSVSRTGATALEFLICHGDSGGGLFIGNKLAGVHSCISNTRVNNILQNDYSTTSYHVRISDHIDWIEKTCKELENNE